MSHPEPPDSYFDTPERTAPDVVRGMVDALARTPMVCALLEAYPTPAIILDENRQIVAFNRRWQRYVHGRDLETTYGLRLGEAIQCVHARDMHAGCGTSRFCIDCGAAMAIRTTRRQLRPASLECRITVSADGRDAPLDLRVHTASIDVDGRRFVVAAIEDIADEKRRQAFERIFFHDVLNTANVVSGIAHMMKVMTEPERLRDLAASLARSTSQLVEEIQAQRDLLNAERGDLVVARKPVPANVILHVVRDMYAGSPLAAHTSIVLDEFSPDPMVDTDPVQAIRCLGNLVKNALEASPAGAEVTLYGDVQPSAVAFRVRNVGVLTAPVRRQMFQRSFSTKAARGRGLGTHSVKLIVEQYLEGRVAFVSDPEHQTVFTILLPRATAGVALDGDGFEHSASGFR